MGPFKDIGVERVGHVALIEIRRPPHNFFDVSLIQEIAGALEALDEDIGCRAVVLAAQGKSFCAGANFGDGSTLDKAGQRPGELNREAAVQHLYLEPRLRGAALLGGRSGPKANRRLELRQAVSQRDDDPLLPRDRHRSVEPHEGVERLDVPVGRGGAVCACRTRAARRL